MKSSTVFLIIGLIVLGIGSLLAVNREGVEAESSATAECGMLELVVRQTGHNARGRPLYRMEAAFVHEGVVYDERTLSYRDGMGTRNI